MSGDFFINRFIRILVLFVFSIIMLIFGGNLLRVIIGWDLLGLTSFCLVIYYSSKDSIFSGILTIIINRIGDALILISIFFFNSTNMLSIDLINLNYTGSIVLMASFLTKRAQFPFSSWLPAAIAAPTPISSLVHSSTLVTAGVYLSIRFNFIFRMAGASYLLIIISLITSLIGGLIANLEIDLKKNCCDINFKAVGNFIFSYFYWFN